MRQIIQTLLVSLIATASVQTYAVEGYACDNGLPSPELTTRIALSLEEGLSPIEFNGEIVISSHPDGTSFKGPLICNRTFGKNFDGITCLGLLRYAGDLDRAEVRVALAIANNNNGAPGGDAGKGTVENTILAKMNPTAGAVGCRELFIKREP